MGIGAKMGRVAGIPERIELCHQRCTRCHLTGLEKGVWEPKTPLALAHP